MRASFIVFSLLFSSSALASPEPSHPPAPPDPAPAVTPPANEDRDLPEPAEFHAIGVVKSIEPAKRMLVVTVANKAMIPMVPPDKDRGEHPVSSATVDTDLVLHLDAGMVLSKEIQEGVTVDVTYRAANASEGMHGGWVATSVTVHETPTRPVS